MPANFYVSSLILFLMRIVPFVIFEVTLQRLADKSSLSRSEEKKPHIISFLPGKVEIEEVSFQASALVLPD